MAGGPNNKQYLVHDGVLLSVGHPLFGADNRAFRYGDVVFETLRVHRGRILFWERHHQRLLSGMAVLQMAVASLPPAQALYNSIIHLVVKNRIFYDARIRLTVYRKGAGLYTPERMQVSWLIEATDLQQTGYGFADKGLPIGIFSGLPKLAGPLSPFKTGASQSYVVAGIHAREQGWDDVLVVNGQGLVIESFNSSLFWVKDEVVYTPLVSSGCIDGVLHRELQQLAGQEGIKWVESPGAREAELLDADEIFLGNVIAGIRWVAAYKNRRYFARISKRLHRALKERLEADRSS